MDQKIVCLGHIGSTLEHLRDQSLTSDISIPFPAMVVNAILVKLK